MCPYLLCSHMLPVSSDFIYQSTSSKMTSYIRISRWQQQFNQVCETLLSMVLVRLHKLLMPQSRPESGSSCSSQVFTFLQSWLRYLIECYVITNQKYLTKLLWISDLQELLWERINICYTGTDNGYTSLHKMHIIDSNSGSGHKPGNMYFNNNPNHQGSTHQNHNEIPIHTH